MRDRECTRRDDKAVSRLAPEGANGRFDLRVAMNGRRDWDDLEYRAAVSYMVDRPLLVDGER
jgi:hypothetical protein